MLNGSKAIRRFRGHLGALFAAFCGAMIAVGALPALQAPVETGQVLAGIVSYPTDNPFYIYHVKLWSLLNQGAAVLLQAGFSEIAASFLLEGLTGALSFIALYLIVFSLSGRALVALFTPLFIFYFNLVGIDIAYPIRLLGTTHTYGIFGLSYAILVIGLLGCGWYRTGAFLAGLAPAFHPSLGAFCVLVSAPALLMNRQAIKPQWKLLLRYFAAGAAITLGSLAWQLHFASHVSGIDRSQQQMYLDAFIQNIDYHRSFTGWTHSGLLLGVLIAGIGLLAQRDRSVPLGARLVLSASAASVVVTLVAAFLAEFVPFLRMLKILMPWRFMNFASLSLFPLVIGLLAADFFSRPRLRLLFFLAMLVSCVIWKAFDLPLTYLFIGTALALLAVVLAGKRSRRDIPETPVFPQAVTWQNWIIAGACTVLFAITALPSTLSFVSREKATIDEIYRFAAKRPGMLLTAGDMHLMQLLTRRPVLLDGGGLDTFTVVPETGPRFNAILKQVYGLDMLEPRPGQERNKGKLTFSHRQLWEERTLEEWRLIRREFNVTDVFVPWDWVLQLPLIGEDSDLRLYTIPGKGAQEGL